MYTLRSFWSNQTKNVHFDNSSIRSELNLPMWTFYICLTRENVDVDTKGTLLIQKIQIRKGQFHVLLKQPCNYRQQEDGTPRKCKLIMPWKCKLIMHPSLPFIFLVRLLRSKYWKAVLFFKCLCFANACAIGLAKS